MTVSTTSEDATEADCSQGLLDEVDAHSGEADAPNKRQKSVVHQYFREDNNRWCCTLCNHSHAITEGGNTSTRIRHLKSNHPNVAKVHWPDKPKKTADIRSMLGGFTGKFDPNVMHELIAEYIVARDLPFTTGSDKYFRAILRYCAQKDLSFKGAAGIKKVIESLHGVRKATLTSELQAAGRSLLIIHVSSY